MHDVIVNTLLITDLLTSCRFYCSLSGLLPIS